jgi:hypothetical protein
MQDLTPYPQYTMEKSTSKPRLWSAEVTKRSNALDLDPGVFTWKDPRKIAESLKRSAEERSGSAHALAG